MMNAAAYIAIANTLTGIITQLLQQAKSEGVDVNELLAKYDAAQAAVQAYTPLPVRPPQS